MQSLSNENAGRLIDIAWQIAEKAAMKGAAANDGEHYVADAVKHFEAAFEGLVKTYATTKFTAS